MGIRQMLVGGGSTISYVGSAKADANEVTLPTHAAGDIILIIAKSASGFPGVPETWTAIETGIAVVAGYKVASDDATVSGTWGSAAAVVAVVYRGVKAVGDTAVSDGSTTISYPALTLSNSRSWVVGLSGCTDNDAAKTPPTGMTNRSAEDNESNVWIAAHDTAKPVSSWSAANGGSTSSYSAYTVELLSY